MKIQQKTEYKFSVDDVVEIFEKVMKDRGYLELGDHLSIGHEVRTVEIPGSDPHDCYHAEFFDGIKITIVRDVEK